MTRIIKPRAWVEGKTWSHAFKDKIDPGHGFRIPCTQAGAFMDDQYHTAAEREAQFTKLHESTRYEYQGIKEWDGGFLAPAVARCDCGKEVTLASSWANACGACGREYNGSGTLLAPREQWGEETGETLADMETGQV